MTGRAEKTMTYAVLVAAALFTLYPIALILVTSLQPQGLTATGWFAPHNYVDAWTRGRFGSYLGTSVIVSVTVVVVSALFASMAGYAFGTMRFRGSTLLFYVMLLGLMVPSEAVVIPLYYDLRSLHLTNTYASLILPQIAQSMAFGTFWMRAYFRTSSREVVEAARLDGAGHLRIFWSILLPMGRPAVVTMMVLIFMWTWNEFLLPLVMITDDARRTAPLGLAFFKGQYSGDTELLAAGAVIVAFPVVVAYLFAQRSFIRGMVEGAVKG